MKEMEGTNHRVSSQDREGVCGRGQCPLTVLGEGSDSESLSVQIPHPNAGLRNPQPPPQF